MENEEAPTKPDLKRPAEKSFPDEAQTKPAVAPVRLPAEERSSCDFSRDPRREPD
jgi:hypothetical protein